jgi:acyl carrier protein
MRYMAEDRFGSVERMAAAICQAVGTEAPEIVTADSLLADDLGIDSFQSLEIVIVIEQMAGLELPPPQAPDLRTLRDAVGYLEYCQGVREARL